MADFSKHTVNARFRAVYFVLEEKEAIRSKSELAKALGTYNHIINQILKGARNLTLDQILRLCEAYHVNANYLFGTSERMFSSQSRDTAPPIASGRDELRKMKGNITMINSQAEAGYAIDPGEWLKRTAGQRFTLPGIRGDHLAFEIRGDSMYPTLTAGDWVICKIVEDLKDIKENNLYVLITDSLVAKRVQTVRRDNQLAGLTLISDNRDLYPPYHISLEDLQQIMEVRLRITKHDLSD